MRKFSGSIGKIESFSTVDGPGIRSAVFLNGCPLRCIYCHNPEFLKKDACNYTAKRLADLLISNKPYFKNGGGVTFSGGEPLIQSEFILEVSRILKQNGINIALDTSGVGKFNQELLNYIDLVLLDIKANDDKMFEYITGANLFSESINFLKLCEEKNIPVIIRQVIVPKINDKEEDIIKLKELVSNYKVVKKIELLPYHTMAKDKYKKLGIPYKLKRCKDLSLKKLDELNGLLKL